MEVSAGTDLEGREHLDATSAAGERRAAALVWGAAVLLAALGTAIAFMAEPGMNWGIWTTAAGAGLLWLGGRRRARSPMGSAGAPLPDPVAVWGVVLASVVAWGAAVTANDLLQFFIVASCVVLLAAATRVIGGMPGAEIGMARLVGAPLVAFGAATVEAGRRAVVAVTGLRGARHAAMVRGIAIAIPVAGLFALVLAGADPMLTVWRDELWAFVTRLAFVPRLVFFVGLGTIVLGAYGIAARSPVTRPVAPPRALTGVRVGVTERRVIVGSVAGVFGAFLAVQPAYLFQDTHALRVSGLTYAEYAHRGFTELTIAATLAVALVVALDRYTLSNASPGRPSGRWRHWGTLLLVAEVLVVLASAFHRLTLYESAYGYTMLRLYVEAYVVGVAITLLLLAREVADIAGGFDARRLARRTGVVAVMLLVGFSFGNPEAWVVAHNGARYRTTGKLDTGYLASLSLNAAPALVSLLSETPPECGQYLRRDLGAAYGLELARPQRMRWFEWNVRRVRGLAALRSVGIARPTITLMWRSSGCNSAPTATE